MHTIVDLLGENGLLRALEMKYVMWDTMRCQLRATYVYDSLFIQYLTSSYKTTTTCLYHDCRLIIDIFTCKDQKQNNKS